MTLDGYRLRLSLRQALYRCSWSDVRVCVNPRLHRPEWYHAGQQRYLCAICERINASMRKVAS